MTPEMLEKLKSDAMASGIDISSMMSGKAPMMQEEVELPVNPSSDLVSFAQSIWDAIVAAPIEDVMRMIAEVITIKTSVPQMEAMQELPPLPSDDLWQIS